MSRQFQVVRYQRADRDAVFAFLPTVYPTGRSDRLIRQWDWKYDANPFNRDGEPYLLLLRDGSKIIGMYGALHLPVCIGGTTRLVAHSCDTVVHADYRRRGLWRQMSVRQRADLPMSWSWTQQVSDQAGLAAGTQGMTRITPLVKPVDFTAILCSLTGRQLLSRWGGLLAAAVQRLPAAVHTPPSVPGVTITPVSAFDERLDALWERVRRDYPVMLVRDRRYLEWRFVRRPDVTYTVLLATRGTEVVGYLVLRTVERDALRWGYLVDFLVQERSAAFFALLVEEAVARLREQRVALINCRATAAVYRRTLYRYGFLPVRWGPPGYFRARVDLPDPARRDFLDARQWSLTMGDGDLEMDF